jgi:beta-lactamase regulating signal transducer with metallopeptidase domain
MAQILFDLHSVSIVASDFLVASIWQGLLIAGLAALFLRLLPGLTASARSAIWTAVLLIVIVFPGLSLFVHHASPSPLAQTNWLHASDRWCFALLILWAVVSLLRASQLIGSAFRIHSLAKHAHAVTPSKSVAALLRASHRRIELCSSTEVDRPSVAGFFRPRILLSPELLTKLSATELEQVVLHEMEHLRRYDDWTNLLQKLSLALIPLHPVLLWLDRQMCLQRELACDDSVLRQTHARKAYAACLARLAEDSMIRRGVSLALGALGNRERTSELANRVHRILHAPEKKMSRGVIWCSTAVLLATVFAGASALSRTPQLISFTSSERPLVSAQSIYVPHFEPASFHPANRFGQFTARPALFKTVMPQRRPPSILPAVARKRNHPERLAKNILLRRSRPSQPYFALTAWQSASMPVGWSTAVAGDTQILYAAVPMRDGWLIIQL